MELMATAGSAPSPPAETESTPNDTPNRPTAIASGMAVTAPARSLNRTHGGRLTDADAIGRDPGALSDLYSRRR